MMPMPLVLTCLLSTPVELTPNATRQARREVGAERTLYAVACTRLFGTASV